MAVGKCAWRNGRNGDWHDFPGKAAVGTLLAASSRIPWGSVDERGRSKQRPYGATRSPTCSERLTGMNEDAASSVPTADVS